MFDALPPLLASLLEGAATPALVWLATYLLHSSVLLGAAWALSRLPALAAPATQDALWKAALAGGLVTASVFAGSGGWAEWAVLPGEEEPDAVSLWTVESGWTTDLVGDGVVVWDDLPMEDDGLITWETTSPVPGPASGRPLRPLSIPAALGLLWGLGALIEGLRRTRHHRRFLDALGIRAPVAEGAAPLVLADLAERARLRRPVRLTTSAALRSPVALDGWRRAEVCVPGAALALPPAELRALLAHEVAHLARRDPAWLGAFAAVESVLWMQPLHRLARCGQQDAAEALCDGWAATQSAPTAMAGCLLQVAEWLREPGGLRAYVVPSPVVVSMAARPSALRGRVERLIGDRPSRLGRTLPALALVALLAGLVAGMGFSQGGAPEPVAFEMEMAGWNEEPAHGAFSDEHAWVEEASTALEFGLDTEMEAAEGLLVKAAPPAAPVSAAGQVVGPVTRAAYAPADERSASRLEQAAETAARAEIRRSIRSAGLASGIADFALQMSELGVEAAGEALGALAEGDAFDQALRAGSFGGEAFGPDEAAAARLALQEAQRALAEERHAEHAAQLEQMAADLERQAADLRRRLDDKR